MPNWLKRFLWGLLAIIIILPLAGILYQAIATGIDKRNYPPPGELVDVGGYRLYLHCIGENTDQRPSVILETGLGGGATSADWAWVQQEIAKTTRGCAYDRAGLGWSDRSPQPRDAQHIVTELHTLLQNSQTPGPYVLVGWSYGGLYVRAYANQYPEDTAGLVLLDSSSPEQCASTPAWQAQCASTARTYYIAPILARLGIVRVIGLFQPASGLPSPQNEKRLASLSATKDWDALKAEFLASPATSAQILRSKAFGAIPLFVVTATDHGAAPDLEQSWQVWQSGFTALSTNSAQRVVPGATHESLVLSSTGAKVSVEAIQQVVEAARTGERLKP
jgi:pimeloyl-ACP methyl ester carboxylesterase